MRPLLATIRALFACALFALSCAAVLPPLHASLEPIWLIATESALHGCMIALVVLLSGIGDTRVPGGLVLASASAALFAYVPLSALWMGQHAPFAQNPEIQQLLWESPHGWHSMLEPPEPSASPAQLVIAGQPSLSARAYPGAPSASEKPTVIILEGSDWTRDGDLPLPWADLLALHGYPVLAVSQRSAEGQGWDDESWGAIMNWLTKEGAEHGLDRASFYLMGQGAGGHTALQVAYRTQPVGLDGVMVWSSPTDLGELWEGPSEPWLSGPRAALAERLGGTPEAHPAVYLDLSPITHVDDQNVRTLVGCGGRDLMVPVTQCGLLEAALTEAGSEVHVVTIPWATSRAQSQPFGPSGILWRHAVLHFLTLE